MTPVDLDAAIARALAEDLAAGDLTTAAIVPPGARGVARALAKAPLVVCGSLVFARVFYQLDPGARVLNLAGEGSAVEPGTELWRVEGDLGALLMGERTALNFAQRLSGIATLTRRYVSQLPGGTKARITDTRKTTPGLRALERHAVRTGGGYNHRDNLGAGILIKENHITAAGSVTAALERARASAPHTLKLEIEVETLAQLDEALAAGADVILLDNFEDTTLAEAVRRCAGRCTIEVSGNVTPERVPAIAAAGVDVISVGALTHSAPAADISLLVESLG